MEIGFGANMRGSARIVYVKVLIALIGFLAAGCATTPQPADVRDDAVQTPVEPTATPLSVPPLDRTQHSVPLDDIYFDTFRPGQNRAVPLTEASPEMIRDLRDRIPPIHSPAYEPASAVDWLADDDIVIGYVAGNDAWAFPIRILNFHEIVNDTLGNRPVLVSYCPLCYSGVVFSRRLPEQERVLTFGNTSALYESDMVMLDYETGSYWWHVAGRAIVGPLTGTELELLPSNTLTWREWRTLHPNTRVLSRDTGYERDYSRNPFLSYAESLDQGNFAFPVSEAGRDPRLSPATKVLAVRHSEKARAYPLADERRRAINDQFTGDTIVVFLDPDGPSGTVFKATVDGRTLHFSVRNGDYVDEETGSVWNLAGRATEGLLDGTELTPVPAQISFWFAIVAAEPDISVYQLDSEP